MTGTDAGHFRKECVGSGEMEYCWRWMFLMKEVKECFYADHIDPGSRGEFSDVEKRVKNTEVLHLKKKNSIGSCEKGLLWI